MCAPVICCGQHVSAFCLHRLGLLEEQLETVDLRDDLPLQMLWQRAAITGPKLLQLVRRDPRSIAHIWKPLERTADPLDPVHHTDALGCYPILNGDPVVVLPEKEQTIGAGSASYDAATNPQGAPLYLKTIGVSGHRKS